MTSKPSKAARTKCIGCLTYKCIVAYNFFKISELCPCQECLIKSVCIETCPEYFEYEKLLKSYAIAPGFGEHKTASFRSFVVKKETFKWLGVAYYYSRKPIKTDYIYSTQRRYLDADRRYGFYSFDKNSWYNIDGYLVGDFGNSSLGCVHEEKFEGRFLYRKTIVEIGEY